MSGATLSDVVFNSDGLVPAVIQDGSSGRVLMLGYMTAETLAETLSTGRVVYWSRSRQERWRKGDTSGNIQIVERIELDCDADTLLITVQQHGPACHDGHTSCFDSDRFVPVNNQASEEGTS